MKLRINPFSTYRVGANYRLSSEGALEAGTGRVTVITGESGTGKSVLLQAIAGYRPRTTQDGSIEAAIHLNEDEEPLPLATFLEEPTRLSYLPQLTVLRPQSTPARAVEDWCSLLTSAYGEDAPVRKFVDAAREELEDHLFSAEERDRLFGASTVRVRNLSGGQKRRLDVMMALCSPAELILLDEPDTGLDPQRRQVLFQALVDFARAHRKIILLVSHYAGEEYTDSDVDIWRATRRDDGTGGTFTMQPGEDAGHCELALHIPPPERGNQRLDQYVLYVRQRLANLETGRAILLLAAPALLLAAVRLAMYPDPVTDGPSMGLMFFYSVTCFWLGTVQATGFWADERTWFNRECRQGTSSLAYLLSFLTLLIVVTCAQVIVGGLVLKFASWQHLLAGQFGDAGDDLEIGVGRILLWGFLAGTNGFVIGLLVSTLQHGRFPRATSPATAQLLALFITLSAIVFSFPIVGSRAYENIVEDPFAANRLRVAGRAAGQLLSPDVPAAAIALAEIPVGANPSFHGLWFQGERPLRYGLEALKFDDMQKEGVPEALINLALAAGLTTGILLIGRRMKRHPVAW